MSGHFLLESEGKKSYFYDRAEYQNMPIFFLPDRISLLEEPSMSISRRDFVQTSALAAGALATVGYQKSSQAADAQSALRVAVLGVNARGLEHLDCYLRNKNVEVTVICDPDTEVGMKKGVKKVEEKTGKAPRYVRDLRDVFADPNVDIVSIATPHHWHPLATIWAAQAGKAIYCEKPVSHNIAEGRRAVQAVEKYKVICQCGTQSRSHKAMQDAVAYVQSGKIGEVKLARGLCYKPRKGIGPAGHYKYPESVDVNIWTGPAEMTELTRPKFHYDWHWQWNCGNGDSGNQGIHQMDIARWGLGINDLSQSIVSFGKRYQWDDAGTTPNTQIEDFRFADGKRILFETRNLDTEKFHDISIGNIFYGTEGIVAFGSNYGQSAVYDLEWNKVKEFKGGSLQDHFDNFIEAVQKNDSSHLNGPFLEGHLSSSLCHTGNISYQIGKEAGVDEIRSAGGGDKEWNDSLERMLTHLKHHDIDAATNEMYLGPKLTFDGQKEVFTGEGAEQANALVARKGRGDFIIPEVSAL